MRRNGLVLLTFGLPLALYLPIATGLAPTDTTQVVPSPEPSAKTRGTDPLFLQLSELQARLATLRAQYTDAHPDVIDVRQQIADLKAQLENKYGAAPPHDVPAKPEPLSEAVGSAAEVQRQADDRAAPSARSSDSMEEEKADLVEVARLLAVLLDSGRVVVGKAQPAINNPRLGDKGFSSAAFDTRLRKEFQTRTGHDLRNLSAAQMPQRAKPLLVRLAFFMKQTIQDAQPLINQKGIGFKGFIPATFATRVAEKFSADTGLTLRQIGPPRVAPRNPNNRPNDQEERALNLMQKSHPRVGDHVIEQQAENRAVGVILPLFYSKQCLACHGSPKGQIDISGYEKEGFKEGDLGGAISVMVPIDNRPLKAERER